MDDLSSKILRTESLREIESLLEESIAGIEFIGEVDINEEAFGKIGAELRRNCRKLNWYSESVARLAHSTAKEELINDLLKRNRAELKRQGRSLWSITVECLRPAIFCASMVLAHVTRTMIRVHSGNRTPRKFGISSTLKNSTIHAELISSTRQDHI